MLLTFSSMLVNTRHGQCSMLFRLAAMATRCACTCGLLLVGLTQGCVVEESHDGPNAVVSVLISLLSDPDAEVRRNAVLALGRIEHPSAVSQLVDRLGDADPRVREASAWALGNLGEVALDEAGIPMVQRFNDPADTVKRAAAEAVGAMGATQAMVEGLTKVLREGDTPARRAAVQALGGVEARSAYHALIEAMNDKDSRVRQGAVAAVGELGESKAVPLLRNRLDRDTDVGVRAEAAYRVGKLGSGKEIAWLRVVAAREQSPIVRRWVRWAEQELTSPADSDSGP